ncbi:MAG: DUF1345 domain-containing protein [Pseudomonadota bacterium]|nr:DUF1345 domain-containing protein [Pseudomonadota bacterium]
MPFFLAKRPRLLAVSLVGILLFLVLPQGWRLATRLLAAWDSAVGLYLALVAGMMAHSDVQTIRRRAAAQDEGGALILTLTTAAALASLAAIVAELAIVKTLPAAAQWPHIVLAGVTVLLSWAFMQMIFALHYAHQFYAERHGALKEGLEFPGHAPPDYWDFVYYSFIIGTAVQTADVNITSRTIRRTTTVHCVVAFFFNTIILALTINISAGLF